MKLAHPPPAGREIRINSLHILTLLTFTYIGLRLTGMFTGGRKKTRGGTGELESRSFPTSLLNLLMLYRIICRRGQTVGGYDQTGLSQYTFLAEKPIVTCGKEF
jgi:hypothetical protein